MTSETAVMILTLLPVVGVAVLLVMAFRDERKYKSKALDPNRGIPKSAVPKPKSTDRRYKTYVEQSQRK